MPTLSIEDADNLVLEHKGWAESIARSVARAWNMDWQQDGLDGAALEALIFCSRRFDPERGIPFRGYARKRIHEASTDAARRSRGWKRSTSKTDQEARQISAELFNIFPELHDGELPAMEEGAEMGDGEMRGAIRQMLVGAVIIATRQGLDGAQPDEALDYKRMIQAMATLEPVHQNLMWRVYWEGESMRTLATNWQTDELNVIREHKVLLTFLHKCLSTKKELPRPRVRPGLKPMAVRLKKSSDNGQFSKVVSAAL